MSVSESLSGERRPRTSLVPWLAAATVFYAVFIFRTRFVVGGETYFSLFDDAMIVMRYARNLAEGYGLVWNPGGAPVEGYTNLLWLLWMALLHLLGAPESKVSLLVAISGAVVLLVNLYVVRLLAHELSPGSALVEWVAVAVTAFCYPLIYWTLRGMEVGVLSLAVNGAAYFALRLRDQSSRGRLLVLGACLAAQTLLRPDGVLPAALIAAFVVLAAQRPERMRVAAVLAGFVVVPVVLQTLFRLSYYGEPLPNTYYLKMTGVSLGERMLRGLSSFNVLIALELWPAVLLAALNGRRLLEFGRGLLFAIVAVQCAYSVYVGGDAWEWMNYANRYITVALPALIVLSATGIQHLKELGPERALRHIATIGLVAGAALLALGLSLLVNSGRLEGLTQHVSAWIALVAGGVMVLAAGAWRSALPRRLLTRVVGVLSGGSDWRLALVASVLLLVALSGRGAANWVVSKGHHVDDDAAWSTLGLRIRRATAEDASIAVVTAGAIAYFAHRRAIDLLGKNDVVIAKDPPRAPFFPGHNKWDYRYSISTYHPDLIVQLWRTTPADLEYIAREGYEPLGGGMLVRRDSRLVDRAALGSRP